MCFGAVCLLFFFSSRRRHTRFDCDWSSDVCSSDLPARRSCARPRGSSAPSISSEKAGFPMTDLKRDADRPMPDVVGILPLRGTVLFPQAVVPLGAGRASSVRLIEEALQGGRLVGAVTQKDPADDAPGADGLHSIGTLTVIHKALKQPDGTLRLVAQGVGRFRLLVIIQTEPYLKARIEAIEERAPAEDVELEALVRSVTSLFSTVISLSPALPDELVGVLANVEGAGAIADMVAASLPTLPIALKQELLE